MAIIRELSEKIFGLKFGILDQKNLERYFDDRNLNE